MKGDIKKSLFVTLDFPPNIGGVATYYYNICKNLPPDKVVVLAPEHPEAEKFDQRQDFTIIRDKNLNFKTLPGPLKVVSTWQWLKFSKRFNQIVKNHSAEIIQVGNVLPLGTLALINLKQNKTPYIFYAHGLDITYPQKFLRKKKLLEKIISNSQSIVANSYYTKDELTKLGAQGLSITVVHPCPNVFPDLISEVTVNEVKKQYGLQGKKIMLTVGRLIERKGHDMVIKALPQVLRVVPNTVYLIVGDGPYKKTLRQLSDQLGLKDVVIFAGKVGQKDLPAYFQLADVFTMPSRKLSNGDVEGLRN